LTGIIPKSIARTGPPAREYEAKNFSHRPCRAFFGATTPSGRKIPWPDASVVMADQGAATAPPSQRDHPFNLIGKEVERRAQEGEDVIVLESTGQFGIKRANERKPVQRSWAYPPRKTIWTAAPHAGVWVSQHSVERFLDYAPSHCHRAKLEQAVEKLESALRALPNRPHPCT